MSKIRRIFPGGNTTDGFYSFHDNIIGEDRNMLYILKGMPGGGKSSLMNNIASRILEKGYSIEYHHCPSDPGSIDGIVIIELKVAIVDGTSPHIVDATYPGLQDRTIDLSKFINSSILEKRKEDIFKAKQGNKQAYRSAYNYLAAGKMIYNELIEFNKRGMDYEKVNRETRRLMDEIFSNENAKTIKTGIKERHLFSSALTPEGYIDYTESILEPGARIYYINGNIGSGRSTLLKRLLEAARLRNYHIEVYHNPLIVEKIESLFIKELNIIVTCNERGKSLAGKKLDLNQYYSGNLNKEDYKLFEDLVEMGIEKLKEAKNNHFILEKAYRPSIDYGGISQVREEIFKEILEL